METTFRNPISPTCSAKYSIRISCELNDPEWDTFLERTPGGHHVQSSLWAQVKSQNQWKTLRILACNGDQIIGGAQILLRTYAPFANIAYLTKGPVVCDNNLELAEAIVCHAIKLMRKQHVQLFAIQPAGNGYNVASRLPSLGFQPSVLELAPVASLVLDLSASIDQIAAAMKRQTRQNIRRGEQAGMIVREGCENDLDAFYEFYTATSKRQGFYPYAKEYYIQMRRVLEPHGYFKLFVAEYEHKPVSGLLVIPFGDTVIAKILGWSGNYHELRPNDCLFWNVIQWSKDNGYHYFDFEGIKLQGAKAVLSGEPLPEELKHSPDFFKLGYGGQVTLFPPAFEMIPNPLLNWVYKKASPTVGGESAASRLMDRLRKV